MCGLRAGYGRESRRRSVLYLYPSFEQQDCRVAGSHGFNQFQNMVQRRAVSNDVLEVHLAADLFFEVELLLGELFFEF